MPSPNKKEPAIETKDTADAQASESVASPNEAEALKTKIGTQLTKEQAKDAIRRFYCSITLSFPRLDNLYSVETTTNELYMYDKSAIEDWLRTGNNTCPNTKQPLNGAPLPCKSLFSLVLAIIEASGHLEAVKKEDSDFSTFTNTQDYTIALQAGKKLLTQLLTTEGKTLKEKVDSLNHSGLLHPADSISGSVAQLKLLNRTLGMEKLDINEFANYYTPWKATRHLLLKACINGEVETVRAILKQYPEWLNSVLTKDEQDENDYLESEIDGTPLMLAVAHNHPKLVQFLLNQAGMDALATCDGETALTYALALDTKREYYTVQPRPELASFLLRVPGVVNQVISYRRGNEVVQTTPLLRAFAHAKDYYGQKSETKALAEHVSQLLDSGADIDMSVDIFNTYHKNSLYSLKIQNQIKLSREHLFNHKIWPTLRTACKNGNVKTLDELLKSEPMKNNQLGDDLILELLNTAVSSNQKSVVQYLLEHCNANELLKKDKGRAALQSALNPHVNFENAHYDMAKILIQAGADINAITINDPSFLLIAWSCGNETAARELVSLGADIHQSEAFNKAETILTNERSDRKLLKESASQLLVLLGITDCPENEQYARAMSLLQNSTMYEYENSNAEHWNPEGIPNQIERSKQYASTQASVSPQPAVLSQFSALKPDEHPPETRIVLPPQATDVSKIKPER